MSIPTLVLLHGQNNFDEDWVPFVTDIKLPFDHTEMVNLAYNILASNWDKYPLPLLLTGDKITLEEMKDILSHFLPYYEKVIPSNLRQMMFAQKFLTETDELKQIHKVVHHAITLSNETTLNRSINRRDKICYISINNLSTLSSSQTKNADLI